MLIRWKVRSSIRGKLLGRRHFNQLAVHGSRAELFDLKIAEVFFLNLNKLRDHIVLSYLTVSTISYQQVKASMLKKLFRSSSSCSSESSSCVSFKGIISKSFVK